MIITETVEINAKQFTRTYSNAGFYIQRDGVNYAEAIDPENSGRTYTETDVPVETGVTTEAEYLGYLSRLRVDELGEVKE